MPAIEYECQALACRKRFIRTMEEAAKESPKCPYCGRQWSTIPLEEVEECP